MPAAIFLSPWFWGVAGTVILGTSSYGVGREIGNTISKTAPIAVIFLFLYLMMRESD